MSENTDDQNVADEEVSETKGDDLSFVEEHKARITKERESTKAGDFVRGSTLGIFEYFEKGLQEGNRWMFDNALQRIYRRLVAQPGIVRFNHDTFPKRAHAIGLPLGGEIFMPRLFLKNFYGMEYEHDAFVRHMLNAARGGEAALQMFVSWGPPGVAKSRKVDFMRDHLTDATIFHLKDCEVKDSPFLLIPLSKRAEYAEEFGIPIPTNKDICLVCRYRLREDYGGKWEDFPVEINAISRRRNVGSSAVAPFDPNTQGSEVLIGDEKFWLPPDIPMEKRLRFSIGAFAQGQGGIIEFREILKAPKEIRNLLLISTQDQEFPTPNYYEWISSDFLVIAHANIPEVVRWRAQRENDAFFDRMNVVLSPYSTSYQNEANIHAVMQSRVTRGRAKDEDAIRAEIEKEVDAITDDMLVPDPERLIDEDYSMHRAPQTRYFAAQFAVASRLDLEHDDDNKPKEWTGKELRKIVSMLNGEGDSDDLSEHIRTHFTEGFEGVSPRFMLKALEDADAQALLRWGMNTDTHQKPFDRLNPCTSIGDVREALERRIRGEVTLARLADDRQDQERWERLLSRIGRDKGSFTYAFLRTVRRQLFNMFQSLGTIDSVIGKEKINKEIADAIHKYRISLFALSDSDWPTSLPDTVDGEFMSAIERHMGVEDSARKEFREEFYNVAIRDSAHEQSTVSEESHNSEGLLKKLYDAAREHILYIHRDEYLRAIADLVEKQSQQSPRFLKNQHILTEESPYCAQCLAWTLRLVTTPFLKEEVEVS